MRDDGVGDPIVLASSSPILTGLFGLLALSDTTQSLHQVHGLLLCGLKNCH